MAELSDKNGVLLNTDEDVAARVLELMLQDKNTDYSQLDKACIEHIYKLVFMRRMTMQAISDA